MYAFWKYDLYPYVLGGRAISIGMGKVQVESYAVKGADGKFRSGWFKPILLLDDDRGVVLKERLDELAEEYRQSVRALEEAYAQRLRNLMAPYGAAKIVHDRFLEEG